MTRSAHSPFQGARRATGGCPWHMAHLSTSSIHFLRLTSGEKETSTSLRVEGKEVSCKWNWGTHCRVMVRMTPRQPRRTRTAWNTSVLLDSEHSRMVPSAVSRVNATTWQREKSLTQNPGGHFPHPSGEALTSLSLQVKSGMTWPGKITVIWPQGTFLAGSTVTA